MKMREHPNPGLTQAPNCPKSLPLTSLPRPFSGPSPTHSSSITTIPSPMLPFISRRLLPSNPSPTHLLPFFLHHHHHIPYSSSTTTTPPPEPPPSTKQPLTTTTTATPPHQHPPSTTTIAKPAIMTSHQRQLSSCLRSLPPDFAPSDLSSFLLSLPDPDLAHDVYSWASLRPNLRHHHPPSPLPFHTILRISIHHRRLSRAESLLRDLLSGACPNPDLPLLHTAIRFSSSRPRLLPLALDLLNLLPRLRLRPSLPTFLPILSSLVRRLPLHPHSYLLAVRSLARRMKASGVASDTLSSNLFIKAHSHCLRMDDALRVFDDMRLHPDCCDPNEYTYGYLARGMCEAGRTDEGLRFYREMRGKGLVPRPRVYAALSNCLSMERRFDEASEVVRDMVANGARPDLITCRTLLEGMCREGRGEEARGLLEEVRRMGAVEEKTYYELVDGMRWLCPP